MTKTKLEKVVFRNELHHHKNRNMYDLTNRFHFAVRLYSDNAQMTSKRGENKEVRYEPQASSVTDVLTRFDVLCALSECRPTAKWNLFVLYNNQDIATHFVSEHRVV